MAPLRKDFRPYGDNCQGFTLRVANQERMAREIGRKDSVMFVLLLPGAICAAVGLGVVRTVEAVEKSFKRHSSRTFTR